MAIIYCRECGKEFSELADKCPSCGAPNKIKRAKTRPIAWLVLAFLVVFLILIFPLLSKRSDSVRKPPKPSKPEMPIKVGYRNAAMGPGKVLQVKNRTQKLLTVIVTLKNSNIRQKKSYRLDIKPKKAAEIGHLEGWVLETGDSIEIYNNKYRTWKGKIP